MTVKNFDPQVYEMAQSYVEDTYPGLSSSDRTQLTVRVASAIHEAIQQALDEFSDEREKDDDDGVDYAHPGDRLRGLE